MARSNSTAFQRVLRSLSHPPGYSGLHVERRQLHSIKCQNLMKTSAKTRKENPKKKKQKISETEEPQIKDAPIRPPSELFNDEYLQNARPELQEAYQSAKPFKHLTLENIMKKGIIEEVIENLQEEYWFRKKNDLYTFKQTDDLKASNQCGLRDLRHTLYSTQFRGFLQSITGIKLNDVVDISAHVYPTGGNLLCHDDELEGRRIAFIIYLVPDDWKEEDGGSLDLFSSDAECNPIEVVKSLIPKRNRLMFFEVGPTTWHQVSEVIRDRNRMSISGWFHGEPLPSNPHPVEPDMEKLSVDELKESHPLVAWINEKYLEEESKKKIRKHFEKASSIGLNDFLLPEIYAHVFQELKAANWKPIGPPQRRHYDTLGRWGPVTNMSISCLPPLDFSETETDLIFALKKFLRSPEFLGFLQDVTGLKILQAYRGEFRRFKKQDYTLVQDFSHQIDEEGLDVGLGFQEEEEWKDSFGGFTTYMDEKTELVCLMPQKNTLSIVFRDKGCMRFVKFLTSNAPSTRFDLNTVYFPLISDDSEGSQNSADFEDQSYEGEEGEEVYDSAEPYSAEGEELPDDE